MTVRMCCVGRLVSAREGRTKHVGISCNAKDQRPCGEFVQRGLDRVTSPVVVPHDFLVPRSSYIWANRNYPRSSRDASNHGFQSPSTRDLLARSSEQSRRSQVSGTDKSKTETSQVFVRPLPSKRLPELSGKIVLSRPLFCRGIILNNLQRAECSSTCQYLG